LKNPMGTDCPVEFRPGRLIEETLLRQWLGSCGSGVKVYQGCRILFPERLHLGHSSQIDEGAFIHAGEGVTIGNHVHLAYGSAILGGGKCLIHDYAGISPGARLITGTDNPDGSGLIGPTIPASIRAVTRGLVEIQAHALIFANATILPNVTVGEGAVVAAGAIVHHSLKPWGIYAGSPLVQIGVRPAEKIRQLAAELAASEGGFKPGAGRE
jgi:acetyltransferase-like isoleucine patch superfamily enzyme